MLQNVCVLFVRVLGGVVLGVHVYVHICMCDVCAGVGMLKYKDIQHHVTRNIQIGSCGTLQPTMLWAASSTTRAPRA